MMIAWMITKIMCLPLWLAERSFPLVPLVFLSPVLHKGLLVLFFVLASALILRPNNAFLLGSLLCTEVTALLADQLRWQPWEYQFLGICLVVLLNRNHEQRAQNGILFIFAASYFFSGIFKMNAGFLNDTWPHIILKRFLHLPRSVYNQAMVRYAGLAIPVVEVVCGVLLLQPRYYRLASWLPMAVHVFIIACFSPLGLSYDYIVFPWNLFMMAVISTLLLRNRTVFSVRLLFQKLNPAVALAFGLLPAAGIVNLWPPFFSFKLYSGMRVGLAVYIPDSTIVAGEIKPYLKYSKRGYQNLHTYFRPFDWCDDELNVPIPPETRLYEAIGDSLKERYKTETMIFKYY